MREAEREGPSSMAERKRGGKEGEKKRAGSSPGRAAVSSRRHCRRASGKCGRGRPHAKTLAAQPRAKARPGPRAGTRPPGAGESRGGRYRCLTRAPSHICLETAVYMCNIQRNPQHPGRVHTGCSTAILSLLCCTSLSHNMGEIYRRNSRC